MLAGDSDGAQPIGWYALARSGGSRRQEHLRNQVREPPIDRKTTDVRLHHIGGMDEPEPTEDQLVKAEGLGEQTLSLLERLQGDAPVGFGFVDRDFRYVRVNATLAAINGYSVEDHVGRTVAEVVPDLWPKIEPLYRRVLDLGESLVNVEMTGETGAEPGRTHHWAATYYPVRSGDRVIGIGVLLIDITERKQAEEFRAVVMDNMAEGLYALDADGRLMYMNRAASAMLGWTEDELRGKPMHETVHFQRADGSPVPAEECALLQVRTRGRSIRIVDEAFTRKNGSIFPVAYSSAPLRSGTTIQGIVVVFRDITEEKEDQAVGRRVIASLSWVGRIRDAIDENRLVLYSQPIVPLANGHPSEELLLRMIGRDGEVILPGTFLHVAEKYGLIGEIDRWVISQAVRFAASGRRVIEANLSATSIGTSDLLPFIERELRKAGADPSNLVFEMTETALMQDIGAGEAFARGLAEIGCGLALDDFGTGFGSFTYLKRLPISGLKIDVEFIRDLVINPANLHVVKAIVSLAQAFGMWTIAEGIEDEETLTVLRAERVDFGQGFYFGHPAPTRSHSPRRKGASSD